MNIKRAIFVCAALVTVNLYAAEPVRSTFHRFGLVGLAERQTARINVVLLEEGVPGEQNANYVTSLSIETFFVNGDGRVISRSAPRVLQEGIGYGHELPACPSDPSMPRGECAVLTGGRAPIRAVVRVFSDSKKALAEDHVVATLEIFDNDTGKTQVVLLPAVQ